MRYEMRGVPNLSKRAMQRARWMAEYEHMLVTAKPELAGKVDWDTATYQFNNGLTPQAAAARIISPSK